MAKELLSPIVSAIEKAQAGTVDRNAVFTAATKATGKHEFLFFMKPEILLKNGKMDMKAITELVLERIEAFGFKIDDVTVLSGKYLEDHNIVSQHYGVINQIASNAANVSDSGKAKFKEIYGMEFGAASVLGGLEFLKKFPSFNAESLEILCDNVGSKKLAGGTYAVPVKIDGATVHVLNGFHPKQVIHFTQAGRAIVVFNLKGDMDWASARQKFIGSTKPTDAEAGSVRRSLLENKDRLGIDDVSMGYNGAHLSAGPVEGLVELVRYNSDFASGKPKAIGDFQFGKQLEQNFSADQIKRILANDKVEKDGQMTSIFDLTEEKDADASIELIKKYLK